MVQLIILGLAGICLLVGILRRVNPPRHLEAEALDKHQREATKLIVVSTIAGLIGVSISFIGEFVH